MSTGQINIRCIEFYTYRFASKIDIWLQSYYCRRANIMIPFTKQSYLWHQNLPNEYPAIKNLHLRLLRQR